MYKLSRDINDKRVIKLIRRYLQSGIMININANIRMYKVANIFMYNIDKIL